MVKEKKYYTEEDVVKLDSELEFVPLTYDKMFKGIFKKNLDLLKELILSQLEFEIDKNMCKIELFNSELVKDKVFEYGKKIYIYVRIHNMLVILEVNREYFKNVEMRCSLDINDKIDNVMYLKPEILIQINLNINNKKLEFGTDKLVYYGLNTGYTYDSNSFYYVKYLQYYRDLYYNGNEEMGESSLWLVMLTSKSFVELYNILGKLVGEDKKERFIKEVIDMNNNKEFFKEWEVNKLDEQVENIDKKNLDIDDIKEEMKEKIKYMIGIKDLDTIKNEIREIHKENKEQVPTYLDNLKEEHKMEIREVECDNDYLKYML